MNEFLKLIDEITDWLDYIYTKESILKDVYELEEAFLALEISEITDEEAKIVEAAYAFIQVVKRTDSEFAEIDKMLHSLNTKRFHFYRNKQTK